MTPIVEIAEYESVEVELTVEAEQRLRFIAGTRLTTAPGSAAGRYVVTAAYHVGAIVTPDLHVIVRPKVLTSSLLYLLGAAPVDLDDQTADLLDTQDLVPALAMFFAVQLEQLFRRGIIRGYLHTEERVPAVRGRIDVAAQVARGGLSFPVACQYDEHTANIRLNRRVRAGTLRLLRLPGVAPATCHRLGRLLANGFDDVGELGAGDLRPTRSYTRLDEHYRSIDKLAQLVLSHAAFDSRQGTATVSAFTVNMNSVFESFVARELTRELRGVLEVTEQRRGYLDREHRVPIEPDLVFSTPERGDVYVADSKYKLTSTGLGRQADYYQLLAYCAALDLPEGVLVYCRNDGDPVLTEVQVGRTRVNLRAAPLTLAGRPRDITAETRRLAASIIDRVFSLNPGYSRAAIST